MSEYNLRSIRAEFKNKGIFYTTPELALYLRSFLPDDVKEIYDPTCGNGGLLSVFGDEVKKYGQDINAEQVQAAEEHLMNFHGAIGDTLTDPAFRGKKFKYIIANPPFSIKWEPKNDERFDGYPCLPPRSKADYAFIAHILHCLTDDGTAVVLNFPGILYRGQAEGKIRKYLVEQNLIDTVAAVDGGHFVDTKIATAVVILKKNKTTTDIQFIHNDNIVTVPVEQVAENGYNLSVSSYIIEELPRLEIDEKQMNADTRGAALEHMRSMLRIERAVCELTGEPIKPFLDSLRRAIAEFESELPPYTGRRQP